MTLASRPRHRVDHDGRAYQRHEAVVRQALYIDVDFLNVGHRHGDRHGDERDPEQL